MKAAHETRGAEPAARPASAPSRAVMLGARGDPAEAEADRAAERLAGASARLVPLAAGAPPADDGGRTAPQAALAALAAPGTALAPAARARMEAAFGRALPPVTLHAGPQAAVAADALGATAWTVGRAIGLAAGAPPAGTPAGDRLLAHEIAHVLQAERGGPAMLRRQPREAASVAAAGRSGAEGEGRKHEKQGKDDTIAYVVYGLGKGEEPIGNTATRAFVKWIRRRFGRLPPTNQRRAFAWLVQHFAPPAMGPIGDGHPCSFGLTFEQLAGVTEAAGEWAFNQAAKRAEAAKQDAADSAHDPDFAAPDGEGAGYARPALPASISGLEVQPVGGTGDYWMRLDWRGAGVTPLEQVANAQGTPHYQWEVWDITGAPELEQAVAAVRARRRLAGAPRDGGRAIDPDEGVAHEAARALGTAEGRSAQIAGDARASLAEGRYADLNADLLNGVLLPLEHVTRFGRLALDAAAEAVGDGSIGRIAWRRGGVFVVRCIATIEDGPGVPRRAPSTAVKLVTTRSAEEASAKALDQQRGEARELADRAMLAEAAGGDPAQVDALRAAAERQRRRGQGTPLEALDAEIAEAEEARRAVRAEDHGFIEAGQSSPRLRDAQERIDRLMERRELLRARDEQLARDGAVLRVRAVLVSRVTGAVVPLLLQLGAPRLDEDKRSWTCTLSDVSSSDARLYEGEVADASDRYAIWATALERALARFAATGDYGEASLSIELPGRDWVARAVPPERRRRTLAMRGDPAGIEGAKKRLGEAAALAAAIGLAVGSAGTGMAAGAIAAGLAAANIARRAREGTLRMDAALAGDLMDVLGGVALGVKQLARGVTCVARAGSGFSVRAAAAAAAAARASDVADTIGDAGGLIVGNAELLGSLLTIAEQERRGDISPSEARSQRFAAAAAGLKTGALALAGRTLRGRGAIELFGSRPHADAPAPHGAADAPTPARIDPPAAHATAAPPARPAASTDPAPHAGGAETMDGIASGATPMPPPRPDRPRIASAHEAQVALLDAFGMAPRPVLPTPADTTRPNVGLYRNDIRSFAEALAVYEQARARAPDVEVGIYLDLYEGHYAVTVGDAHQVRAPSDDGTWSNVIHNHPNPEHILTFRHAAPATDMRNTWAVAARTGRPVRTFIEFDLPDGRRGYTSNLIEPNGRVTVDYLRPDGTRAEPLVFDHFDDFLRNHYQARSFVLEPGSVQHRRQMLAGDVTLRDKVTGEEKADLPDGRDYDAWAQANVPGYGDPPPPPRFPWAEPRPNAGEMRPRPIAATGVDPSTRALSAEHEAGMRTMAADLGARPGPRRTGLRELPAGREFAGIVGLDRARTIYEQARARAPEREVGLFVDLVTGRYLVVVGGTDGVPAIKAEGRWLGVLHNHPETGTLVLRGPAPADIEQAAVHAERIGRAVTIVVEADLPDGGRTSTAIEVRPDGAVELRYRKDGTGPERIERHASVDAYERAWSSRKLAAPEGSPLNRTMRAELNKRIALLREGGPEALAPARPAPRALTAAGGAAPPPRVVPRIDDPHGRLRGVTVTEFDRKMVNPGGIRAITIRPDPDGRYAVTIEGVLGAPLYRGDGNPRGRIRAESYNEAAELVGPVEAGLPAGAWEILHLVGPGFGAEAAAGMMVGPREVNQVLQNRGVEDWMRKLHAEVAPLGGTVAYRATAVAWDLADGGWQPRVQTDFLRSVEYRVQVSRPGREAVSVTVHIEVARPPATRATVSIDPPFAVDPAALLHD